MRSINSGVCEEVRRELEGKGVAYAEEIALYCEEVCKSLRPDAIILHGSVAKKQDGKWSDVDLIVIADFREPLLDRVGKLLEMNKTGARIEPLGYTLAEFNNMLMKLNPLALEAVKNGIPLFGKELFAQLKGYLNVMEEGGLRRGRITWTMR